MSSIGSIGSTAADLLAAIRQQLLAKTSTSGDVQNVTGTTDAAAGNGDASASPAVSNQITGSGSNGLSSGILSVLIVLQEQQSTNATSTTSPSGAGDPSSGGQRLFSALDSNGDGQISKSELESAFTSVASAAGVTTDQATQAADVLVSKLDTNGDGSISQSEFAAGAPKGHHHHGSPAGGAAGGDPLASLLQSGAASSGGSSTATANADSSTVTTNADGSTTTTITYADGTKITLSTPATADPTSSSSSTGGSTASSDSSAATPTQSPGEKVLAALIRLQEQAFQSQSTDTTSLAA